MRSISLASGEEEEIIWRYSDGSVCGGAPRKKTPKEVARMIEAAQVRLDQGDIIAAGSILTAAIKAARQ